MPNIVNGVNSQEISLPPLRAPRDVTGDVIGVGTQLVNLPAIANVAANAMANLSDFRIQSHTGVSTAEHHVSAKTRETLQPLIETFADSLEQRIARISPHLDMITIIEEDEDGITRKTIYADQLTREQRDNYERLKIHYNSTYGGYACTRPRFSNTTNGNLDGMPAFHKSKGGGTPVDKNPDGTEKRDPSAKRFIDSHLKTIAQDMGMSGKQIQQVEHRAQLAEILVIKKLEKYDALITKVKAKINNKRVKLDALKNNKIKSDEIKKEILLLQEDLARLQGQKRQLEHLDPVALYWLSAFYPKDPTKKKEEMKQQAEALEAKAIGINPQWARDVASILMPDRKEYFLFCSKQGISMRNTQPMEKILREIVDIEKSAGNRIEEDDDDEEIRVETKPKMLQEMLKGYQTEFVKDELEDNIYDNLNTEIDKLEIAKAKKGRIMNKKRLELKEQLVDDRIAAYKKLVKKLNDKCDKKWNKAAMKDTKERRAAIEHLKKKNPKVSDQTTPQILELLRKDIKRAMMANDDEEARVAYDTLHLAHDAALLLSKLERKWSEQLVKLYQVKDDIVHLQKHIAALNNLNKNVDFNKQLLANRNNIKHAETRRIMDEMFDLEDKDPSAFAKEAVLSLETGRELDPDVRDKVLECEERICEAAKEKLKELYEAPHDDDSDSDVDSISDTSDFTSSDSASSLGNVSGYESDFTSSASDEESDYDSGFESIY